MNIYFSQVVGNIKTRGDGSSLLDIFQTDSTDLLNVRHNGSLGHDIQQLDLLYHFLFTFTLMGTQKHTSSPAP